MSDQSLSLPLNINSLTTHHDIFALTPITPWYKFHVHNHAITCLNHSNAAAIIQKYSRKQLFPNQDKSVMLAEVFLCAHGALLNMKTAK